VVVAPENLKRQPTRRAVNQFEGDRGDRVDQVRGGRADPGSRAGEAHERFASAVVVLIRGSRAGEAHDRFA
jgi:hypothetical protein